MQSKIKVLLVEDDAVDVLAFKRLVDAENLPYDYSVLPSIAEVKEICETKKFDIAVVDYELRDGIGLEIFEIIPNTPLIITTGKGNETVAVDAMRRGAADYLIKDTDRRYLQILPLTIEKTLRIQEAKEQLALMSHVVRCVRTPIYFLNDKMEIVYVNREFTRLYGYDDDDVLGQSEEWLQIETELEPKNDNSTFPATNPVLGDVYHRRKDGIVMPVSLTRSKLTGWDGKVTHIIVVQDLADRLNIESERLKFQKLQSLGRLAGGIAHDFNNVLCGVQGFVSLAEMSAADNSEISDYLQHAQQSLQRGILLTQRLLTFARGGSPVRIATDIREIIEDAVLFVVSGTNVTADYNIAGNLWLTDVDRGQLRQVFENLAINAVAAMQDGGRLLVTAENCELDDDNLLSLQSGNYLSILFQDHGVGIPASVLPEIFDPYFTTQGGSSGLGLSTALSIVRNHNGTISIDSVVGKGTTVVVTIPASVSKLTDEQTRQDLPALSGPVKVLVMDDELSILRIAEKYLGAAGHSVETSRHGADAITKYTAAYRAGDPFDAVILDLTVPGRIGGREAMAAILNVDPGACGIVSSGYSDDAVMANYKDYGFAGVIPKPYKIETFMGKITQVIANKAPK